MPFKLSIKSLLNDKLFFAPCVIRPRSLLNDISQQYAKIRLRIKQADIDQMQSNPHSLVPSGQVTDYNG